MNIVGLVGRLTRDPRIITEEGKTPYVKFTLAVQKDFKVNDKTRSSDFIACIAWGEVASNLSKFNKKGYLISIKGILEGGTFIDKKTGQSNYQMIVRAENIKYLQEKKNFKKQEKQETGIDLFSMNFEEDDIKSIFDDEILNHGEI